MCTSVRLPAVGVLLGALVAFTGCSSNNQNPVDVPHQNQLTILPKNLTVEKGQTISLSAQALYADGTDAMVAPSAVTWTSSDETIAKIAVDTAKETATLSALAKGTITITAAYKGLSTNVAAQITPKFLGLRFVPATEVTVPLSTTLTALALFDDNTTQDVSEAATWTAANSDLASISGNVVTGVAAGATTVTASYRAAQATGALTVSGRQATALDISGTPTTIALRTQARLAANATFDDATTQRVTTDATWSTSDKAIATVSNGVVTPKAPGSATITAAWKQGESGTELTATKVITVKAADVVAKSLAITVDTTTLPINTDAAYSAVATFTDDSTQDVSRLVAWSLANKDEKDTEFHAVQDPDGTRSITTSAHPGIPLASYTPGVVVLSAAFTLADGSKVKNQVDVAVTDATPTFTVAASPATLAVAGLADLTAEGAFTGGFTFDYTPRVTFMSSNAAVVTIDDTNAQAIALGAGTADVHAWMDAKDLGSVTITVQ